MYFKELLDNTWTLKKWNGPDRKFLNVSLRVSFGGSAFGVEFLGGRMRGWGKRSDVCCALMHAFAEFEDPTGDLMMLPGDMAIIWCLPLAHNNSAPLLCIK